MMDLKTIRHELHKLTELVEGWAADGAVRALERDLALEKLRTLYDAVRFGGAEPAAESAVGESPAAESLAAEAPAAESLEEEPSEPVAIDLGVVLSLDAEPLSDARSAFDGEEPQAEFAAPEFAPEPALIPEPELVAETEPELESVAGPESVPAFESDADAKPESVPQFESVAEPEPAAEPVGVSESRPEPGPKSESVTESASEAKSEPEPAPVPTSQPATASAEKPRYVAPTLFGPEEDETLRHRHKQRVIMSLYDTAEPAAKPERTASPAKPEPAAKPVSTEPELAAPADPFELVEFDAPAAPAPTPEPGELIAPATLAEPAEPAGSAEPAPLPATEPAAPEIELPADAPDEAEQPAVAAAESRTEEAAPASASAPVAAGAVLGEVINHHVQTLADTIAAPRDMASELRRSEPVTDLGKAIGINDKFLLIRDLFGGDGAAYDEALAALNACADFDECMIYIAENYAWNPNSDGAKLMMDLLERKFA